MLLTDKGFYDSDSVQILLNHLIQTVIRIKYTFKIRMYMLRQPDQINPSTGMVARKIKEIFTLIVNDMIIAKIIIIGARTATRMSI